jgi:hypothetical protein
MFKSLFPDSSTSSSAEVDALADRIAGFLTGEDVRFSFTIARLSCPRLVRQTDHIY